MVTIDVIESGDTAHGGVLYVERYTDQFYLIRGLLIYRNLVTMALKPFSELGGESWRIRRFADENDKRWSAFNPSVAYSPIEGYVVLFRASNYFFDPLNGETVATIGTRVQNRMFLANLDKNWEIRQDTVREIDFSYVGRYLRGPEDGRLYWRDGEWQILSVMREPHITNDVPRLATYRLIGNVAQMLALHDSPDLQPIEKNWMPTYEANPDFDFVYSAASVYKEGVGKITRREGTDLAGSNIRGGSCLWDLKTGSYLAIVHESNITQAYEYSERRFGFVSRTKRCYLHRFAKYDYTGKLIGLSDLFTFQGAPIEFAAGLVVSGEDVIISYGYKDVASYLAKIKLDKVLELINDISS